MSEVAARAPAFTVSFGDGAHPPIRVSAGTALSEALTIANSPILFGCRTGICGTCLSEVRIEDGHVPPPAVEELELLKLIAPGRPNARLACQLNACAQIRIRPLQQE